MKKTLLAKILLTVLGCFLLIIAGCRFSSGIEIWRAYVSLFLGIGNIAIAFNRLSLQACWEGKAGFYEM